jgi:hypothetical protein
MAKSKKTSGKRAEIEKLVVGTMERLGGTKNKTRFEELFASMDDEAFGAWMTGFLANPKANFQLRVVPFQDEPKMDDIRAAAEMVGVKLEDYVTMPHTGTRTKTKVPVGWLTLKRHQQVISKKNNIVSGISKRNPRTGQVIGDSKAARISDMENFGLQTMGAMSTLSELMGPRADDMRGKLRMYGDLASLGVVSQVDLKPEPGDRMVLRTVDATFIGAMFKTDLIGESLVLPVAVERMRNRKRKSEETT